MANIFFYQLTTQLIHIAYGGRRTPWVTEFLSLPFSCPLSVFLSLNLKVIFSITYKFGVHLEDGSVVLVRAKFVWGRGSVCGDQATPAAFDRQCILWCTCEFLDWLLWVSTKNRMKLRMKIMHLSNVYSVWMRQATPRLKTLEAQVESHKVHGRCIFKWSWLVVNTICMGPKFKNGYGIGKFL
jgi:hypothetical protein